MKNIKARMLTLCAITTLSVVVNAAEAHFNNAAGTGVLEDAANWKEGLSPTNDTWDTQNVVLFDGNYNLTLGCDIQFGRLSLNGKNVTIDCGGHGIAFGGTANADFLYCNAHNTKMRFKNGTVNLITTGKQLRWPDRGDRNNCWLEINGSASVLSVGEIRFGEATASLPGSGDNNWIVVTNGALMTAGTVYLPRYVNGSASAPLGISARGNGLLVAGSGSRYIGSGVIQFYEPGCNNKIVVSDNASFTVSQIWFREGTNNCLIVTNGGYMCTGLRHSYSTTSPDPRSVGSTVIVSGEGSTFSNNVSGGALSLDAPGVKFVVSDGGSLLNVTNITLSGEGSIFAFRGMKTDVTLAKSSVTAIGHGSTLEVSGGARLVLEDAYGTTGGRLTVAGELLVTGSGTRLDLNSGTTSTLTSAEPNYAGTVRVTDGATLTCLRSIWTGVFNGGGNLFTVEDGGNVTCKDISVGVSSGISGGASWLSSSNTIMVTGEDSRLSCSKFNIGSKSSENDGSATNSTGNVILVRDGGTLEATDASATSIIGTYSGANGLIASSNAVLNLAGSLHVGRAAHVAVVGTTLAAQVSTNNFLVATDGASIECATFEVHGKNSSLAVTNASISATGNIVIGDSMEGLSPVAAFAGTNSSVRAEGNLTIGGGATLAFDLPREGVCQAVLQSGGNMTFAADTALTVTVDGGTGSADEYVLAEGETGLSIPSAVIESALIDVHGNPRFHLKMSGRRLVLRKDTGTIILFH